MNYTILPEEKCDFFKILPASDLPNGERLLVEIDDLPITILNIADEYYAVKDQCSHEDLDIGEGDLDGYELVCPHHGARFDVRTGEVRSLPAVEGIPAYPIRLRDGMIELGIPKS